MRVLHVISGLGRGSGGPSRSCQGMVAAECAAGVDAWVWPIGGGKPWVYGVRDVNCAVNDAAALRRMLQGFDLAHIHGLWDLHLHKVAVACRLAGVKYVVAPRGMLEPWSLRQKWLKKRIARLVYQDRDLSRAAALHATAESEAEQFRRLGFCNPIIVSPNGVNVPAVEIAASRPSDARRALFVSRMHPKKGVMELVEAWSRLKAAGCVPVGAWKCELVYTVNGDLERGYEAKVKARVRELGLADSFVFTGALDDDDKWNAYARADLFVLPTYSENFGIVVAEALWAGVPVITTKGTPWADLEAGADGHACGWWIDLPPKDSLERALGAAMAVDAGTLAEMGRRGHDLVNRKYTWQAVVRPMVEGYGRIAAGDSEAALCYNSRHESKGMETVRREGRAP